MTSSLLVVLVVSQFEMKGRTEITKRERILKTILELFSRSLEQQESIGVAQSACFHSTGRIHNLEDLMRKKLKTATRVYQLL